MILVDSSVVIDYLNTTDPRMLQLFQAHGGAICGIVWAEVLHGARHLADRQRLVGGLAIFGQVPMLEPIWEKVGDHLAALRSRGVSVPFQDVVIATVAIENDIELWTRDNQFGLMQPVLPALKLFQEPP